MESVLSPLEKCSKIGIFSILLLSLFADRENIQIFFFGGGGGWSLRERIWLGSYYSAFKKYKVQRKGDLAQ